MVVLGTWNLENLFRPGEASGPTSEEAYRGKLAGLAATINGATPDVLGVQEVGSPQALGDLVELLHGDWHVALSEHFDAHRTIRVGVLSRHPIDVVQDVADLPERLAPVHTDDDLTKVTTKMGRGALAVQVELVTGEAITVVVVHLKSKLVTYPAPPGKKRFSPRDEGERARYSAYALNRRAAEAVTVRALADDLLDGQGIARPLVVLGDLNDEPQAATTQVLLGPPGSEIGTAGERRPDAGDAWRLWNLAPLIRDVERYSRIYRGRQELIDHILVSRTLLDRVSQVRVIVDRTLPSITDNPTERRNARDSDHAPVLATLNL
ncbi:endonuclease/exonuclease/phosphatase family protein [Micromonospora sp. NPDC023814]|uniref:endonuclease/exonuclease/phosphatase family protein n=1 Tax=Micromonospora sp. NPDC023814 TaxID=3154596 RepID=UPI0033ED3EF8